MYIVIDQSIRVKHFDENKKDSFPKTLNNWNFENFYIEKRKVTRLFALFFLINELLKSSTIFNNNIMIFFQKK
jgi:hypothetical protein